MFSKLIEYSYSYFDECYKEIDKQPLLILSPSKADLGISLSAFILKMKWREDIEVQNNLFKRGDIIRITIPPRSFENKNKINLHAKVASVNNDTLKLSFGDDSNTILEARISWFLDFASVESNSGVNLSTIDNFRFWINKLKKQNFESNSWSNLLNVNFSVSKEKLLSKVYFISGKYNVEDSKTFISNKGISNIFLLNENLIIKESLKYFAEYFESQTDLTSKNNFFSSAFLRIFPNDIHFEILELNDLLLEIKESISKKKINTEDFRNQVKVLTELLSTNGFSEFESIINISEDYLVTIDSNSNLNNVKCIIINELDLINSYTNTIKELLNRNIGVIVLSDYASYTIESKENYNKFKINFPEAWTLNWEKNKIKVIDKKDLNENDLDYQACHMNLKYFNQVINLKSVRDSSNVIDNFFDKFEINGALRKIDGFEGLKEFYAKHLRPVLYFIKNKPGIIEKDNDVCDFLQPFVEYMNGIKAQLKTQHSDIFDSLSNLINLILDEKSIFNSKLLPHLKSDSLLFQQNFDSLNNIEFTIDYDKQKSSTIIFCGTPLGEVKYRYLSKSIFVNFDNIYFIGFCNETENVYKRFINDNIRFNASIIDKYPIHYQPFWHVQSNISEEINYEKCEECVTNELSINNINQDDFEVIQQEIEIKYRYQSYINSSMSNSDGIMREKVNVLELDKMMKIFLPKKRKLKLFCLRNGNDFNGDWEQILPGDRVFTYLITRKTNLEMRGKTGQDLSVFSDMDLWFKGLNDLYVKFNQDIRKLSDHLKYIKDINSIDTANPEIYNIRNWLNIARYINVPEDGNLMVILIAMNSDNIKGAFNKIKHAERKVRRFDDNNRESIKKEIKKYISRNDISDSNSFSIVVNKVEIKINHGLVLHKIISNDIEVNSDKIGQITT